LTEAGALRTCICHSINFNRLIWSSGIHCDLGYIFFVSDFPANKRGDRCTHQDTSDNIWPQAFCESLQPFFSPNSDQSTNSVWVEVSLGRFLHSICTHSYQNDLNYTVSLRQVQGCSVLLRLDFLSSQQVHPPRQRKQLWTQLKASHHSGAGCCVQEHRTARTVPWNMSFVVVSKLISQTKAIEYLCSQKGTVTG
jgi:hypothetical protein